VLPADRVDAFRRNLDAYDQPLTSWQPYTMKGATASTGSREHAIALSKLKLANGITSRTKVGRLSTAVAPQGIGGRRGALLPYSALRSRHAAQRRMCIS